MSEVGEVKELLRRIDASLKVIAENSELVVVALGMKPKGVKMDEVRGS